MTDQPAITWKSVGRSDVGRVRKANEDAFYHSTEQEIWAVADGMGGLARGDYASGVVAEAFVHFGKSSNLAASIRDLETRLRAAHANCRSSFEGERVGSTVAAILSYGQYCFFLWAGDSRVYRLRAGQLKQMTKDHSVAQQKFERGELSASKVASHPGAHILTRAVGVHQTLHLDLDYETVEQGDRFLVCSDGLYNDLSRTEIQQLLACTDAQTALDSLIDSALEKGGSDNITAIVVDAL
ncbi:hypothetical protein BST96_05255 [Oceanicoccus sagamiensis]|uniref:PPM-type phosphatase domain-containing protein n=1 Tax=Oceanicoccus sagamiensis TaxID=716816 RepID=A0A1X9NKG2_9GAMM|nr:hypothetical protein BST96_05255 [Oceanicoccus sagamiensis]